MQVFGSDAIIGNFRLSDHGLILGSFSANDNSSSLGLDMETVEQYVGVNPVPVYLGSKPKAKLELEFSVIKNICNTENADMYFTEAECRNVLKNLTGYAGYKWMYVGGDSEQSSYGYKVRILKAEYQKANGKVIGINFEGECDSCFAWSPSVRINKTIDTTEDGEFVLENDSDDINNYLLPKLEFLSMGGTVVIKNLEENRETVLYNTSEYETIVMDSGFCTITSDSRKIVDLQDFNKKFLRLVPGTNNITVSGVYSVSISYRQARKVGFL